jgi:hypothetical protein
MVTQKLAMEFNMRSITPVQLEFVDIARSCCAAPFLIDPDQLVTAYANKAIYGPPHPAPKRTREHSSLFITPQAI